MTSNYEEKKLKFLKITKLIVKKHELICYLFLIKIHCYKVS